ncbi:MAG: transcriptional regulator [Sedimenticola sp.]|nr:MAG: transcriptional regulator [Sedimenticola sp.]
MAKESGKSKAKKDEKDAGKKAEKTTKPATKVAVKKTATPATTVKKKVAKKKAAPRKKAVTKAPAARSRTSPASVSPVGVSMEERWRMIATAAYYKAEKRGFAPGNELQDWIDSEAEITALLSKQ